MTSPTIPNYQHVYPRIHSGNLVLGFRFVDNGKRLHDSGESPQEMTDITVYVYVGQEERLSIGLVDKTPDQVLEAMEGIRQIMDRIRGQIRQDTEEG